MNETKWTLLILGDSRGTVNFLEYTNIRLGFNRVVVESAAAALNLMKSITADCMLPDINLGAGNSGLALMEKFRQWEKFIDLPIIAITAHYERGLHKELLEKGFTDYRPRPYQLKEMFSQYGAIWHQGLNYIIIFDYLLLNKVNTIINHRHR